MHDLKLDIEINLNDDVYLDACTQLVSIVDVSVICNLSPIASNMQSSS